MNVSSEKRPLSWTRLLWTFPLHQIISTIGILLLGSFLTYELLPPETRHWLLNQVPYFPVHVALAFLNGFYLQRWLRHQAMLWVWVLPLFVLVFATEQTSFSLREILDRRLGSPCGPMNLDLVCNAVRGAEAAFCTGVSYSLGAFLSRKWTFTTIDP